MTRPQKFLLGSVLAAVVLGASVATTLRIARDMPVAPGTPGTPRPSAPVPPPRPGGPVLRVSAVRVQPQPLAERVSSVGTLRALEAVELQAEINGKIAAIHFEEGSRVRQGDLLVKLNDADLQASLARARHRRQLAAQRERRIASLLRDGISNQDEYDTVVSELAVQESEIALIEAQIAKTEIRAPFEGVVGLRFVSEGSFINANTRIATLQRLDRLKVDFSIGERFAGRIRLGSTLRFSVAGFDRTFTGEIYAYDPRIDPSTRTLLVRALCSNPGESLLPGAFANVELTLAEVQDAILIPSLAVIPGLNEKNVFVVRDGAAERRQVETGTRTESTIHILSGLRPGEVVVTSGLQQMRSGLRVEPVLSPAEPSPAPASANREGGDLPHDATIRMAGPASPSARMPTVAP